MTLPVLACLCAVAAASASPENLQLTVSPMVSAADTPLSIRASGLQPGQSATLSVVSVDAEGVTWSSSSVYVADSAGTIDPATSPAVAGSYTGLDPMGPVDFMTSGDLGVTAPAWGWPFGMSNTSPDDAYSWATCSLVLQGSSGCSWSKPLPFVFSVSAGPADVSVTVQRGPARPVTASFESVAATGFYGVFWDPPAGHENHVGILEFGGSGGGIDTSVGALLAARGYPTLDIAYFDEPGLPQAAENIPLEYFARALRWLGSQPGVNPKRLWVVGWSLGTQAALLLGVHYPNLVHGVVALMPSDVALCSSVSTGTSGKSSIWKFSGKPVPCTSQFDNPHPTDKPASLIPVADIRGPVLFTCANHDMAWVSCPYSRAMMTELSAAHDAYRHELLDFADAGHGIGFLAPYMPAVAAYADSPGYGLSGTTGLSDPLAIADQWPKILTFLRN